MKCLYLLVEILQLIHEISGFSEVLYVRDFLKNSQSSQINLRSSHLEVLCQKMFLEILPNSQKNIFAGISFLIKLQDEKLKLSEAATGDVQ